MSIGTTNFRRLSRRTTTKFLHLKRNTLRSLSKTDRIWNKSLPNSTSNQPSFSTWEKSKNRWPNKRTINRLTKSKYVPRNLKRESVNSMLSMYVKKFSPPRPTLCQSKAMKWQHWKRNSRQRWTRDWRCVKLNTTRSCSAIRMSKKKLRTSKTSRELKEREHSKSSQDLSLHLNAQQWVAARWHRARWVDLTTQRQRDLHQTTEFSHNHFDIRKEVGILDFMGSERGKPIKSYKKLKHLAKHKQTHINSFIQFNHTLHYYIPLPHANVFLVMMK